MSQSAQPDQASPAASVEVFVLTYNDAVVAKRAIESVLNQTHGNLRLTILENGSTDDTPSVVEGYASDPRVRIIRNENNIRSGIATHYMSNSDAEWVSILFSDDTYVPNRIERMLQFAGDSAAIFSNSIYVNETGKTITPPQHVSSVTDITRYSADEHLSKFFLTGNSLHPCSLLIRTEIFRALGGFPVYMHRLGDMYLFAKLLANHPVAFIADRLQHITVWTDQRNESALNAHNPVPAALEASNFVDLYTQPPIFGRLEKIFASHLENIELKTDAERFWYLGAITLRRCGILRREFAFRCLYKAIQLDEPGISRITLRAFGTTAGVYVGKLVEEQWLLRAPGMPARNAVSPFRQYARQFRVLVFFWMLLYRRPRMWLEGLLSRKRRATVAIAQL